MFNFMNMADNYEDRKVACYKKDNLFVDTCAVSDSDEPYETAIAHPDYNDGSMIIVEMYNTLEEAKENHEKWVKIMTAEKPPRVLYDVSTAETAKLCRAVGGDICEPKERRVT